MGSLLIVFFVQKVQDPHPHYHQAGKQQDIKLRQGQDSDPNVITVKDPDQGREKQEKSGDTEKHHRYPVNDFELLYMILHKNTSVYKGFRFIPVI
jgi:hypothetical protein